MLSTTIRSSSWKITPGTVSWWRGSYCVWPDITYFCLLYSKLPYQSLSSCWPTNSHWPWSDSVCWIYGKNWAYSPSKVRYILNDPFCHLAFIKSRVAELFDVLADVRAGKYTRTMVSEEDGNALESQGRCMCFMHDGHSPAFFFCNPARFIVIDTNQMKGKLIVQDGAIVFDKVPIVTPNNDVLVSNSC